MSREQMMEALDRDGYVILPNALSEETCEGLYAGFWNFMEGLNPELNRADRSTWKKDNLPLNTNGLIQSYNVGFQQFTVDAHMLLKPVFEELYGTHKLWTSFDGISFTKRGPRPQYKDVADWKNKCWTKSSIHVDQTTPGFKSVQGGLAVTTQKEDQHVFVCIPGSHKHHVKLLEIWETDAKALYVKQMEEYAKVLANLKQGEKKPMKPKLEKVKEDWEVMNPNQLTYLKAQGLEMTRIPLERGSFVLWDSRTVHSSASYCASAPPDAMRVQIFVCMRPVPTDPNEVEKEMKIRQQAYETGRVSKHSADHIRLFDPKPRTRSIEDKKTHDKMKIPASVVLTIKEQEVYGLHMYAE